MRPCDLCFSLRFSHNPAGPPTSAASSARAGRRPNALPPKPPTTTPSSPTSPRTSVSASERSFYETLAVSDRLSVKRLTTAIQGNHYESAQDQPKGKQLQLPRPTNPSYLYKAEVIDANTLLLDIDLGFEVIRRQPIRLARLEPDEAKSLCRNLSIVRFGSVDVGSAELH